MPGKVLEEQRAGGPGEAPADGWKLGTKLTLLTVLPHLPGEQLEESPQPRSATDVAGAR